MIKIGPWEISIRFVHGDDEERELTAEEMLESTKFCETCNERHAKPLNFERYEEWCIRVGHKPIYGSAGIDTTMYRVNKKGFVVRKKK